MFSKIFLPLWMIGGFSLFLYSFTQVDLSLTISQASIFQQIQKSFQYIGWFNRPLSTYLYIGIIIYLFSLYVITLRNVRQNKLSPRQIWTVIIILAVVLIPSYNAFSYDLFNYIFDARIVTSYQLNPYEYKPLDFSSDPMLSFMRSTHRVYPYGPTWLITTVPLTFIGSEIFALNLLLFKTLGSLTFLGTVFFIKRIAENLKVKNIYLTVALFALNPLVLIEALVSSHNEIVMMFFAALSLYLLFINKKVFAALSLLFSIGIKFASLVLLPIFLLKIFFNKIDNKKQLQLAFFLSVIAVLITSLASGQNKNPEFQPWYLLLAAPFVGFYEKRIVWFIFAGVSLLALFSYVPFLYSGAWPSDIVMIKNVLIVIGAIFGVASYYIVKLKPFKIA